MQIPPYQIHKVMKVYTRQLSHGKFLKRQSTDGDTPSSDQISLFAKEKRQAVIDRVTNEIVDRITKLGHRESVDHKIVDQLQKSTGKKIDFSPKQKSQFVFNVIDDKNEKITNSLSVEDSGFLIEHLERLTKEMVDKNME